MGLLGTIGIFLFIAGTALRATPQTQRLWRHLRTRKVRPADGE